MPAMSSLIASPKDQVVSSGSHPSPAAPVSDPVRVCCVRAKPCPRRLNDQGLLDSYGVYRSPWISCSFARHLVRKHRNQWLFSPPLLHQFPERFFSPQLSEGPNSVRVTFSR